MDKNKKQMRFTDSELSLMKNTFADNDDILKLLRKVFLQVELTDREIATVKAIFNKDMQKLIRKTYLPEIDVESPISQVVDLWMTMKLDDKGVEEVNLTLQVREKLIELLEAGLSRLANPTNTKLIKWISDYKLKGTPEEIYINLNARNGLIVHNEQQLNQLRFLAGEKEETVEQTMARLLKDSSK